jgi:hypothetical protein
MPQPLTRNHLKSLHDAIRAEMRENTKDIIGDQRESLQPIRKDLRGVRDQMREANTKLDAIMSGDVLVTRGQLLRLMEKLKAQGITVDEREIFAT